MYFRWHLERHALTEIVDILDKLFPALSGYLERLTQAGTSGLEFGVYPGGIRKLSDEQEERLKETIAKQRTVMLDSKRNALGRSCMGPSRVRREIYPKRNP